jgi:hypothetical protein
MKKMQAIILIIGYAAFGAIMGWTVFGGIYSKVGRADHLYNTCKVVSLVAPLISLLALIYFKKINRFFLYIVLPYFCVQIVDPIVARQMNLTAGGDGPLAFLVMPYPFTLIWLMSILMYLLDYTLTRILFKEKR